MKKMAIRIGTGVTTALMALSLLAGCGGEAVSPGSAVDVSGGESQVVSGGNSSTIEQNGETSPSGGTATASNNANASTTNSSQSDSPTRSNGSEPSSASSKPGTPTTKPGSDKINPEDYRGTTVRFATWKDPAQNEDGPVVTQFKKEYGINVEIDVVPQDSYTIDIASKVAAGNQPDVYFDNGFFPGSLTVLQPLEAACLDLTDPIWDQGMLEKSTVGGKPYLVNTVGNIWSEVSCVFYNKKLLQDNNITTPEEYYEAGKWTFEAMTKVMSDVAALGPDYIGGYLDLDAMLGCVGTSFYKFENGKFTNGINDPMLSNVLQYISTSIKDGLVKGIYYVNRDDFKKGKMGIAVTDAFGLKKTGYWKGMNPAHIGYTYLPDWDANTKAKQTGLFRGWGLVKGAKNPVGAGIFLRYYLDVNNYDTSSAFLNGDAENFFFKLTSGSTTADKVSPMLAGVCDYLGYDRNKLYEVASADPAQVSKELASLKNVVDGQVSQLNKLITDQAALYK